MLGPMATEGSPSANSSGQQKEGEITEVISGDRTASGTFIPFKQALLVAIASGLGYGFDAYAVNIFGMLSPLMVKELDIGITAIGVIGSLFLVGYTLGTVFFGYLADRVGRRASLKFSIALYGTTTVLGGMVSNLFAVGGLLDLGLDVVDGHLSPNSADAISSTASTSSRAAFVAL